MAQREEDFELASQRQLENVTDESLGYTLGGESQLQTSQEHESIGVHTDVEKQIYSDMLDKMSKSMSVSL